MARRTEEFDVVVVGCGVAGLSAAVSAVEAGARVAVLERAPIEQRGGNSRYTEAFLRMRNLSEVAADFVSNFAANAGGQLDPSLVDATTRNYEDWPGIVKAMSFADPEVISTFAAEAGPTLAWLQRFGVRFAEFAYSFAATSTTLIAPVGGGLAIVEALAAKAEALGVAFFYETSARQLVVDDDGRVIGVVAASKNNQLTRFQARAVILACGGFEGNPEMLSRYVGPQAIYLRPVARGGYFNKGDAMRMALEIGAAPNGDYARFHPEPIDPRSGAGEPHVMIYPYGILVNKAGQRFCDEAPGPADVSLEKVTHQILAQPEGTAFVIFDNKIEDVPHWKLGIRSDQPAIIGNSIAELAERLSLSPDVLRGTIEAFNQACQPGPFDPAAADGRIATQGLQPRKSNFARPISDPPFMAYPLICAIVFTFGGLKTNAQAQVLNLDGEPIPGLFAGGEVLGIYFGRYNRGTSVLRGVVFGRIGGRAAATLN